MAPTSHVVTNSIIAKDLSTVALKNNPQPYREVDFA
jgi:hypothetical protein